MARLTARSAATASQLVWSTKGASASITSMRSERTSMPRAPWPAAGSITDGSNTARIRASKPKRFKPAAASTMASYRPSSSLRKRVSRLPRKGSIFRSGRNARNKAMRRRLDVPTTAPSGKASRSAYLFDTNASRGSSRSITQASSNPCGNSIGTSLSECTAKSARPSSIATSNSLTNRPLPPT